MKRLMFLISTQGKTLKQIRKEASEALGKYIKTKNKVLQEVTSKKISKKAN